MVTFTSEQLACAAGEEVAVQHSLQQRIEQVIVEQIRGRVRGLKVVCLDNLVVLEGCCRTYHDKQLAQQIALELTSCQAVLANQIVVRS